MQLHAVHLDAPLVGGVIEHTAQARVDNVARGERLVQLHLADDVTQRGLRELLNGVGQVVDFIDSLERVHDLEIEQRVNLHLDVILGDNILLVKVVHLLAQVYGVTVHIPSSVHCDNSLGSVHKRDDNIDTRF